LQRVLWFGFLPLGGKREKKAFELLRKNAETVSQVVKHLERLIISLFSDGKVKEAQALGRLVSELESKADGGRREFTRELEEGAFLPVFRGDLARLAERLDGVADSAEEAMRSILLREQVAEVLAKARRKKPAVKAINEGLVKMARTATQTVGALKDAISKLPSDMKSGVELAKEVEELEHESDILGQGLMSEIYGLERWLDPVSIFQLKEVVDKMGNISDRAEDTVDILYIISYIRA
jgi:hypothetical protein